MTCKRCRSHHLERSRRRNLWDQLFSYAGWWPYRCHSCLKRARLRASGFKPAKAPKVDRRKSTAKSEHAFAERPVMAFRTDPVRPQAKILVEADSHDQLNHILLALDRAINSYGRGPSDGASARRAYAKSSSR